MGEHGDGGEGGEQTQGEALPGPAPGRGPMADGPPIEHVITVEPTGEVGRVTITVEDADGAPIEQAAWSFADGPFTRIHEGSGAAAVAPGTHRVRVGGKGFQLTEVQVEVKAGEEIPLAIVLDPKE